jgi:hypothetical protein
MLSRRSCNINNTLKGAFSLLISMLFAQPVYAVFTLEQVLNEPYFDASDIETVRKGGFGVAKIHEVSDREIAVVIACLVKGSSEDALAPFLGDTLPFDAEHLRSQGLINAASPDASFNGISLGENDRDEVQHYLEVEPGYGLNLSSDEIAALQALRGAAEPARVEALLEDILHARYQAYRKDGLAGAKPYAREKGADVSPGQELRKTEENMQGLHELYPDFHNAWLRYPRKQPDDIVGDDYFWVKLNIDDRPAFILSHRLASRNADMHLVGIRDYYVSHFFDVSQRVAVVTRLDSGDDILIYVERAWVDYWSGLASLRKKVGRKVMETQMEHLLEDHGICGN